MFERNGARVWALPAETTAHVDWLVYVLESLHAVDPKRSPGRPDWQKSAQWGSAEMREAIAELDEIETERFRMIADFDARAATAHERLRVATQGAVSGPQRVLTEQGEQLEIAVQQLLDDLGFDVVHMDAYHETSSGGRLEDLRVSPPGGGWTCLVEIKGYASGAKANDISKVLGRPSTVYAAREGRGPDAVWHVVNAWRRKDPATREVAIPQSLDLIDLAAARGCLIDTRDLFRAWRDVQSGHAQPEGARTSLMEARTPWTWQGEV